MFQTIISPNLEVFSSQIYWYHQ